MKNIFQYFILIFNSLPAISAHSGNETLFTGLLSGTNPASYKHGSNIFNIDENLFLDFNVKILKINILPL